MKNFQRLLFAVLGAIAFTISSWQLPSFLTHPYHALSPAQENIAPKTLTIAQQTVGNVALPHHLTEIIKTYPEQTRDYLLKFVTADQLTREGRTAEAEALYRQVKPEVEVSAERQIPDLIYSPEELRPESLAHWNTAQEAIAAETPDLAIPALQTLFANEPGFIEAPIRLGELLIEEDEEEEAIAVLEQASTLHPDEPNVVHAWVLALAEEKDYLEASIAAREFALVHPDESYSAEFAELADKYFSKFKKRQRRSSILGGIGNLVSGIITGDRVPWESLDSVLETANIIQLMVGSESQFGDAAAEQYKQSLTLVQDPEINDYVTQLGNEMAGFMGRDDFNYEFFVVQSDAVNASAFPGGKVFVNTGAILAANSQAQLTGLMAHEVAHAVLSHGVQGVVRNDLLSQLADEVPFGEFVAGLTSLHYSRNQERQADRLGARVLARAGYAADGLQNFMMTLASMETAASGSSGVSFIDNALSQIDYFSTHPATEKRVDYLGELIQQNGYNRYALEGVDRHLEIKAKVRSL